MIKTIAITGSNSGIGKALAYNLAERNHNILLIARDSSKTDAVYSDLIDKYGDKIELIKGDLSKPDDIKGILNQLCEKDKIDVLINNAGLLKLKEERTEENIEMTMSVNYLAIYRLTMGLILAGKKPKRILNVSSELFKKGEIDFNQMFKPTKYKGAEAYNNSKLAIIALSSEIYDRYGTDIEVVGLHPGVVSSDAFRDYPKWISKLMNKMLEKPDIAASKIVKVVLDEKINNGYYYNQENVNEKLDTYIDKEIAAKLFEISKKYLIGSKEI